MSDVIVTGPGRYEQRDGSIATVETRCDGPVPGCPWHGIDGLGSPETWGDNGSFWGDGTPDDPSDYDLVRRLDSNTPTGRQLHEMSDGTWRMVEVR